VIRLNTNYRYEHIDEWYAKAEDVKPAAIEVLTGKLCELPEPRGDVDKHPVFQKDWDEVKTLPEYHYKTGCIDDPAVIDELNRMGLHYQSLEMAATYWVAVTPVSLIEKQGKKVPLLIVIHKEDYADPFWAMKTMKLFSAYNDAAAQKQDRTIIYVVSNNGEPIHMLTGMITEGIQNYCGDKNSIYIDLGNLVRNGVSLKDLDGFEYKDENGAMVADPDNQIEIFGGIPVLNFSNRWVTPWRPPTIENIADNSDGTADMNWLIHSGAGRKLLDANRFARAYQTVNDPKLQAYWQQRGLQYNCHYVNDERWVIFTPSQTIQEKLPLVVCLYEVNEPDDHSVVRAYSDYEVYCDVAAQGDCAVIFFAMESPERNDWLRDIVAEAAGMYPIDLSRVYLTGHSHNGHFTQELARRFPGMIACICPLGNSPGLQAPSVSHEAVVVDDERALRMETIDMPTCIICGCKEVGGLVPINKSAHAYTPGINVEGYAASAKGKIEMWNRRLKAERCPPQSIETILVAQHSENKASRELGFSDACFRTIYIDGFEHYIADIENVDGKYHFRVVAIENMPHMTLPSMHLCAWNYMRRFSRNQQTGEIIELG
jgi:hypothetical protein